MSLRVILRRPGHRRLWPIGGKESHGLSASFAFVGQIVPETPEFTDSPYFSQAGNTFQRGMIEALLARGVHVQAVISGPPIPSFPRHRSLACRGGPVSGPGGIPIILLPFFNLGTAKWLTMGCAAVAEIIHWAHGLAPGKPRVVLLYNLSLPPAWFALAGARLVGARTVAFVADMYEPGEIAPATMKRRADFTLQKRILRHLDGLIVMSPSLARRQTGQRQPLLVDCAIADETLRYLDRRSRAEGRAGNGMVFGFAGALEPHNGVREAIAAFKRIADPGLSLWIAGRGSLADETRDAAREDPRIEFLGQLELATVLARYGNTDVLLNCRITRSGCLLNAFPSKLAELLASGAVVVTTNVGDLGSELGGKAIVVEEGTTEAFEEAMRKAMAMTPAQREAMGLAAREWIHATRSWTVQSDRILEYISSQVLAPRDS